MLSLACQAGARDGGWRVEAGALVRGGDWIRPVAHPMLLAHAFQIPGGRLGLALLEDPEGAALPRALELSHVDPDWLAVARADAEAWPLAWMWLEVGETYLELTASRWPTLPVYVAESARTARASWAAADLYPWLPPRLDREAARCFVERFEQPYGVRTLVDGLHRIPARHSAVWQPGEAWRIAPWGEQAPPYPRELTVAADPPASLERLLKGALDRALPPAPLRVGCGMSGGLDSAVVTAAALSQRPGVRAYGLVLPGDSRAPQSERRATLAAALQVTDTAISVNPEPSWAATATARAASFVASDELIYGPFDALYAAAAADGCVAFLTGFGGDELMEPYWDEIDHAAEVAATAAPRSTGGLFDGAVPLAAELLRRELHFAQESAMGAAADTGAQMLRHGLWPIHPLVTPELSAYCQALPWTWRCDRRAMRELAGRLGVPERIWREASPESFSPMFADAFADCAALEELLRARRLSAAGYAPPGAGLRALKRLRAGRAAKGDELPLIALAVLETTLGALQQAHTAPAEATPTLGLVQAPAGETPASSRGAG